MVDASAGQRDDFEVQKRWQEGLELQLRQRLPLEVERGQREETIRHLVADANAYLDKLAKDPTQALLDLFEYMFEGALRLPYVSKAHLHAAFNEDDYSGPFPSSFAPVMLRIRDALREHVPGLDEQTAGRRTVLAMSSILFPACFAELYRPLRSLDSARDRRAYLEEIIQQLLAAAPQRSTRRKKA